ncbi:hypothetical protein FRB98_008703 [Tulasnella sp. 332]|nr:hypothetical protein FRB98_008703 [Tulasnella sp. 332]
MSTETAQPSLVLHHLNDSRSQRILWLLEELQVPYQLKKYQRLPSQLAPPELKAIHPLGRSPVITDGDVTLAESGAIVEYIITKYGKSKAQPPQPFARAVCNNIIAYVIDNRLKGNFAMIEQHMQKVSGGWFAGGDEPTSADYMMLFGMEAATSRLDNVPDIMKKYVERVHAMYV